VAAGWIEEEGEEGASHAAVTRLASVAALGGFLFGYDSAVINGVLSAIQTDIGRLRPYWA
jgi:MFS transporter, SP family, sugar:H+ symporter